MWEGHRSRDALLKVEPIVKAYVAALLQKASDMASTRALCLLVQARFMGYTALEITAQGVMARMKRCEMLSHTRIAQAISGLIQGGHLVMLL